MARVAAVAFQRNIFGPFIGWAIPLRIASVERS
jgi:hypothetical protein